MPPKNCYTRRIFYFVTDSEQATSTGSNTPKFGQMSKFLKIMVVKNAIFCLTRCQ